VAEHVYKLVELVGRRAQPVPQPSGCRRSYRRPGLGLVHLRQAGHRDFAQAKGARSSDPAAAGDDATGGIGQRRVSEAEALAGESDLRDLL